MTEPSVIENGVVGDKLFLTFNESVILNEDWTPEDWRIEISGPLKPYNVTWDFLSAPILMVPTENISVWFQFAINGDKQFFGNGSETLTIFFDDLEVMNSLSYNFGIINKTVNFTLFPSESQDT